MKSTFRTRAGRLPLSRSNAREQAVMDAFCKQIANFTWDFSKDGGAIGDYRMYDSLPRNAIITDIYSNVQVPVAGAPNLNPLFQLRFGKFSSASNFFPYAASPSYVSDEVVLNAAFDYQNSLNYPNFGPRRHSLNGLNVSAIAADALEAREIYLRIGTNAATAGRVSFTVEYYVMQPWSEYSVADFVGYMSSLLGASKNFAILGGSGSVTTTGTTTLVGTNAAVGVSPGTSITGTFVAPGGSHSNDADAIAARAKYVSAYAALNVPASTQDISSTDLAGLTLGPGVYTASSTIAFTGGILTLDAGGDPNAQFIFRAGSAMTTAAGVSVVLVNGAQADNVNWRMGTAATFGATNAFKGNVLAGSSIVCGASSAFVGRLMAEVSVTCAANTVTLP